MFLQKCFKASSIITRNTKNVRWFSIVRINDKSTVTLPYNFSGIEAPEQTQLSRTFENALEIIYGTNVADGFEFAYKTTLEAIANKDLGYCKDTFEPHLYYEIEKGITQIDELKLKFEKENFDNEKVKMAITSMSVVFGVHHVRMRNYPNADYKVSKYSTNPVEVEIYKLQSRDDEYFQNLFPMIRVDCTFYSARNILLTKENGEIIAGSDSSGFHTLTFESTGDPENATGAKNLEKMLELSQGFFGMFRLVMRLVYMKGVIKELFPADDTTWKIVDIDGHLSGNPYVSK